LARLRDPGERGRIAHYFTLGPEVWENRALTVGWENIWVSQVQSAANKWVEGMSVAEAAARRGQDPVDTVLDLLVEEELAVTMITFYGAEAEASEIAARPWVMPCSDGIYGGKPHPRLWGAFPRFFRRFVRKERRVEMVEAVRRATSLPARTFGLVGRGVIAVGAWADLVLFDPELLGDRATYAEPELPPAGIEAVLVNGELVVESGRLTGAASGRVVRRREP
jgi:N-acyl-D-amino-acid deacylase